MQLSKNNIKTPKSENLAGEVPQIELKPAGDMKLCLNCGDRLLVGAKKCPCCGAKGNQLAFINSADTALIAETIAGVPHPEKKNNPNWEKNMALKSAIYQKEAEKKGKKQAEKERLQRLDTEKTPYCPKCHSTSLTTAKKGYGIGKGVAGGLVGAAVAGPVGLLGLTAGNIGAKKVRVTCLNCGHSFYL